MGAIHFSIDEHLVQFLSGILPLDTFVETGTYEGDSIDRVKPYFKRLYSIELSDFFAKKAASRFQGDSQVSILQGDAGVILPKLMSKLKEKSVLFFLDSHWCDADSTAGITSQCSLTAELRAIGHLNEKSVIAIDDARLFLSPPGVPHDYSQWPDLDEIFQLMVELSKAHALLVLNDTILFFPAVLKPEVKQYAHEHGVDWLRVMDIYRQKSDLFAEMEAKETEIKALSASSLLLEKDLQIKDREIQLKEKEIALKQVEIENIGAVAQQRLYLVQQFESAHASIRTGFESHLDSLKAVVAEKEAHIDTLNQLLIEKQNHIEKANAVAESRLMVIGQQENAIRAYQERQGISAKIRMWLQPRLGVLYHYPPRPMKVPEKYKNQKGIAPNQDWPLISVATPSYNQAEFIGRTLESVLSQGYPNLEYIVQDGGSDDGTADILKSFSDRLARWESVKDEGQADAINTGLGRSTGSIMSYLNSDDLLLPGTLHYVARYFKSHPEIDVVYGHRVLIDEYDQEIGRWVLPPHDNDILLWADYIPQETLFWRRSIWEKAGGYVDAGYKFAMDWELLLRLREAGARFKRLPRFLGAFRVHPHQKTSAELQQQGELEMGMLRKKYIGRSVSPAEINFHIKKYLYRHVFCQKMYRSGIFQY